MVVVFMNHFNNKEREGKSMSNQKNGLVLLVAVLLVSMAVGVSLAAANPVCVADNGATCGGSNMCCFAGPTFCFEWSCLDY